MLLNEEEIDVTQEFNKKNEKKKRHINFLCFISDTNCYFVGSIFRCLTQKRLIERKKQGHKICVWSITQTWNKLLGYHHSTDPNNVNVIPSQFFAPLGVWPQLEPSQPWKVLVDEIDQAWLSLPSRCLNIRSSRMTGLHTLFGLNVRGNGSWRCSVLARSSSLPSPAHDFITKEAKTNSP